MVNDHDNTNKEIKTMANSQDKTKIMNGGDVTHVSFLFKWKQNQET